MKVAAGYVRCSTELQDESVEQQKRDLQDWARGNEFHIVKWYEDEGQSGVSFSRRPAFARLVRDVESRPDFQYILVYDESRWGRAGNPRENTYWKFHFERCGVKVIIVNSNSKNENDIGSFVVEVVESAEASEYSKKLSRATKRGCIARNQAGFSSGGAAPYGYKRVALHPHTGTFIRDLDAGVWRRKGEEVVSLQPGDPAEVAVIRRIFDLKSKGNGFISIADILNREGIPCPKRGKWRNKDQKWSTGTIRSLIMNPVYYGARVYNKFPKNKLSCKPRSERSTTAEWLVKESAHAPLVTKELFEKANTTMFCRFASGGSRKVSSPFLLSGLIKCSHCGFNYSGFTRSSKNLRYYADSGYINKGNAVCTWHAIPKEDFEDYILKTFQQQIVGSSLLKDIESIINCKASGQVLPPSPKD